MVATYDPELVILVYKGYRITGYADGSFVSAARNSDSFDLKVGADGRYARSASADKSGELKVTLLATSASNAVLSAEHEKDVLTKRNTGALLLKDASGKSLVSSAEAWLKRPVDLTFSKEIEANEWTFVMGNMETVAGGNE